MNKAAISMLVLMAIIPTAFANGNGESQETISGVAVMTRNADGTQNISIQTDEGKLIQVAISKGDLERLRIRDQERLRINGVYLGETGQTRAMERIFARTITRNGKTEKLREPIQLTGQERALLRAHEAERKAAQSPVRSQNGDGPNRGPGDFNSESKK